MAQRVPGGLGSQIFKTLVTGRCHNNISLIEQKLKGGKMTIGQTGGRIQTYYKELSNTVKPQYKDSRTANFKTKHGKKMVKR